MAITVTRPRGRNTMKLPSSPATAVNGGADHPPIVNYAPVLEDLRITPSKFITTCQAASLAADG